MSLQFPPDSELASAIRVLRGGEIKGRWAREIRCLTLPSFAEGTSWVLCLDKISQHGRQPAGQAHFFTWREDLGKTADRAASTSLEAPHVEHVAIDLTAEDLAVALAPLESICLPVLLRTTDEGLDGTTGEFAMSFGPTHLECSWWENGPTEWEEFVGAISEVERRLYRLLNR